MKIMGRRGQQDGYGQEDMDLGFPRRVNVAGLETWGASKACETAGVGGSLIPCLRILWHPGATGNV